MLKNFPQPTLVMRGEKTQVSVVLISEAISKCIPAAQLVVLQNVNHNGPMRDPAAFTGAIFEFLSRVEQSTLPHLDVRTSSCGELNRLIAGIAVEATKFELVINHQDRQDPGALPPCRTMLFARPHEVIE